MLLLTAALLNLSSLAPRAATTNATAHAGEVTLANGVAVDGSTAMRGQTFFSGSRFAAADKSQALLSLDNLGRVELSEAAALKLDFDGAALGGALEAGRLRVYAPRGVAADFATTDAHVRSDLRDAVSFHLRATNGFTEVSVQSGSLEVRASGGASRVLKAGESFTTAPDPRPQQNSSGRKRAGIIAAIATVVAIVAIALTARGDETPEQNCFGGQIVVSGIVSPPEPCF
jgi:ferric-dicitrate binding protein FerR (iron transport regulator)